MNSSDSRVVWKEESVFFNFDSILLSYADDCIP
jgi:hypothetical protein